MGANRTTFEKLQRDRAKKAKAAAKRERRMGLTPTQERVPGTSAGTDDVDTEWDAGASDEPLSAEELLALVEQLHAQYDSKAISFEEFEERKTDLMARISVD